MSEPVTFTARPDAEPGYWWVTASDGREWRVQLLDRGAVVASGPRLHRFARREIVDAAIAAAARPAAGETA